MHTAPIPAGSTAICVTGDAALRASIRKALAAGGFEVREVLGAPPQTVSGTSDLAIVEVGGLQAGNARAWLDRCVADRVPVLAVGAQQACIDALGAGAVDWYALPFEAGLLLHRAAAALRLAQNTDGAENAAPSGHVAPARAGGLPTTPNQRGFLEQAKSILTDARTRRGRCALLVLNAGFDRAHAHVETDALHGLLVDRLNALLGPGAKHGPDSELPRVSLTLVDGREAVLLLEQQDRPQEAYRAARRLQQELSAPVQVDGAAVGLQLEIGIALHPEDGDNPRDLLRAARRAAARARREQGGGIRFAQASMDAASFQRLTLESALRSALDHGELSVHYQPRVEIATNKVAGFEALLRWQHPELGSISPAQFIPIAEESGLIVPIGEWVLREACMQNRRWREAGLPQVRVSVNLSPVQFRLDDLEARIARALEETGLDAEGLELELTESMLLSGSDSTVETLRMLREMGIRLAIDDFGTGYSSLSYIKHFPIDSLKIDQSFVREVTSSPEDAALTTSIVLLGRNLNLTVVAEGVETRSQLEFLRVLECAEAQGYLFGRPAPPSVAERVLRNGHGVLTPEPTT